MIKLLKFDNFSSLIGFNFNNSPSNLFTIKNMTIAQDSNSIEGNSRLISLPKGVKSETGRFFISS